MTDSDEDYLRPPSPRRVAERALALSAVVCRGFIEKDYPIDEAEGLRTQLVEWLTGLGIFHELEPKEAAVLVCAVGEVAPQEALNAGWRSEGLAVLAWALHRYNLPAPDELVDPFTVTSSLGFLDPSAAQLLTSPSLCPREQLLTFGEMMFALHWRLREFSLRPELIDFVQLAREAWFGPLHIEGLPLVNEDLGIGGLPISQAGEDMVGRCLSIASERHQAINWLLGYHPVYSEVSTDT